MSRYLLISVAAAAAIVAPAGQAAAQASCQPRLQNVAQRVSELPSETPASLHDQLSELYEEALALEEVEPSRCVAVVMKMEALLAGRGGGATARGAGQDGPSLPRGQSTIEMQDGRMLAEPEVLQVPPLTNTGSRVRPPNAFTESVVNYWTGSSVWERGRLLAAGNEYIDALRSAAEEIVEAEEDEAVKRRKARAASEAIHAVEIYQHVVLVNEPEDMLAARQMDALLRLRELSRRALAQWARDDAAEDEFEPAPLERGFEPAPLTRDGGFEPAPLVSSGGAGQGGNDYLAPLRRPEDNGLLARISRKIVEVDAILTSEVRKVLPWIEDRPGFVEPREY